MMDCESHIHKYYSMQPTRFSVVHSLSLLQGKGPNGDWEQRIILILCKSSSDQSERLNLEFDGVRKLRIQQPDWSEISIGHLEIRPAKEMGNVVGNYLVRDPEQECIIWFACRDFSANVTNIMV